MSEPTNACPLVCPKCGTEESSQIGFYRCGSWGENQSTVCLYRQRDKLLAENGRLSEDAARLDWLESVMRPGSDPFVQVYLAGLRNGPPWTATAFQCELRTHYGIAGDTLREAIDNCKADAERRAALTETETANDRS